MEPNILGWELSYQQFDTTIFNKIVNKIEYKCYIYTHNDALGTHKLIDFYEYFPRKRSQSGEIVNNITLSTNNVRELLQNIDKELVIKQI